MGMYTELHYNAELLSSTPLEVLDVLSYMVKAKQDSYRPTLPRHSLFETDRWDYMLVSNSYYFAADTHSTLRYDAIAEAWFICIRCNFKNYCDELRKFCEWIDPYVSANEGEFLGFSRYENSELPDLIFKQGNPPPPGRKPEPEGLSDEEVESEFRAWWNERYGSAYFGAVPLVSVIEWTQHVTARMPTPQPPADGEVAEVMA